jgi:phosphomannomutase
MMSNHVYIFDVDGTLTPSRAEMDKKFLAWFLDFADSHKVYLVTGSNSEKTIEQIGIELYRNVECVYNCSGNTKWRGGTCIFSTKKFELPEVAHKFLVNKLIKSDFDTKTGAHFDARPGLLNFSIIGRNATKPQRKKYVKYDIATTETGLDIITVGKDKAQILKDFDYQDKITFFGDSIYPGGNDYAIAQAIEYSPYKYSKCHQVKNWKETWKILKSL